MQINCTKLLSTLAVICVASSMSGAPSNSSQDFPSRLSFEIGDSEFASGDSITIQEIRGTADTIRPGGIYVATGTYTLESKPEADLSLFVTTTNRVATKVDAQQTMHVKRGRGTFRLVKQMTENGYPHLTFYTRDTGQGFGGIYFGQGQSVLREKGFSYHDSTSGTGNAKPSGAILRTGPNQVLHEYLGNPVPAPENMEAAYTKDGLTDALQGAARKAGVSLEKLQIDDSEFPFLVGVVCASEADLDKLIDQLRTLAPLYKHSGGVGSHGSSAMNLVPHTAFPNDASQRIYRRMLLREAVLFDKITGVL